MLIREFIVNLIQVGNTVEYYIVAVIFQSFTVINID